MKNLKQLYKNLDITIVLAVLILIFGVIVIIYYATMKPFNDWSFIRNSELFAHYGEFIGGFIGTLFTIIGIILLYKTLISQQKAFESQDSSFKIQKES